MFVYIFSPSALKKNIYHKLTSKCLLEAPEKQTKNAPSAKFPPMFVYTFSPSALKNNNNIIN